MTLTTWTDNGGSGEGNDRNVYACIGARAHVGNFALSVSRSRPQAALLSQPEPGQCGSLRGLVVLFSALCLLDAESAPPLLLAFPPPALFLIVSILHHHVLMAADLPRHVCTPLCACGVRLVHPPR